MDKSAALPCFLSFQAMFTQISSTEMEMNEGRPVRFGIIGCATIARKLCRAISRASNAVLQAIGSRSIDKAKNFLADLHIDLGKVKAYGSYGEVVDDPEVDAVYIPLPTSLHAKWAVAAAEKKKHVLLEKPVALCLADLDLILRACASNGVQFMDGTMWLHHPRTCRMKALISDARLFGRPVSIHSSSTFMATPDFLANNIRVKPELDSLGALGDLGWYSIGAILWAMDYVLPATVTAHPPAHANQGGVILACGASLHWTQSGVTATFFCSFLCNMSMTLDLSGTCGSLQVKDLAIPYGEQSASFEFTSDARFKELHIGWTQKPEEVKVENETPQEVAMVREFAEMVKAARDSGWLPDGKWGEVSRKTQMVVDAVRSSTEFGFKAVEL